jgi:hypothetical protein
MWTRLITELERPYRTSGPRVATRAGDRISRKRNRISVRRESEGVVVPSMIVQDNAIGGKDPYFVYASEAGMRG